MMAGVKILKLRPCVGNGGLRRVAARRYARGVNGCVLRVSIGHLAASGGPRICDRMLRVETGARGGDLHRIWRINRVRRTRGNAGKWRVVVAAQIEHYTRRQADHVPIVAGVLEVVLPVVGPDVVELRNANGHWLPN